MTDIIQQIPEIRQLRNFCELFEQEVVTNAILHESVRTVSNKILNDIKELKSLQDFYVYLANLPESSDEYENKAVCHLFETFFSYLRRYAESLKQTEKVIVLKMLKNSVDIFGTYDKDYLIIWNTQILRVLRLIYDFSIERDIESLLEDMVHYIKGAEYNDQDIVIDLIKYTMENDIGAILQIDDVTPESLDLLKQAGKKTWVKKFVVWYLYSILPSYKRNPRYEIEIDLNVDRMIEIDNFEDVFDYLLSMLPNEKLDADTRSYIFSLTYMAIYYFKANNKEFLKSSADKIVKILVMTWSSDHRDIGTFEELKYFCSVFWSIGVEDFAIKIISCLKGTDNMARFPRLVKFLLSDCIDSKCLTEKNRIELIKLFTNTEDYINIAFCILEKLNENRDLKYKVFWEMHNEIRSEKQKNDFILAIVSEENNKNYLMELPNGMRIIREFMKMEVNFVSKNNNVPLRPYEDLARSAIEQKNFEMFNLFAVAKRKEIQNDFLNQLSLNVVTYRDNLIQIIESEECPKDFLYLLDKEFNNPDSLLSQTFKYYFEEPVARSLKRKLSSLSEALSSLNSQVPQLVLH